MIDDIARTAELIRKSRHLTVSTGAGISVESRAPLFRGKDGEAVRQGEIVPLLLKRI